MKNIYNILYDNPVLHAWQMPRELEKLARRLVVSGRLRIDAEEKVNFVHLSRPGEKIDLTFSYRELVDETLIARTISTIRHALSAKYKGKILKQKTNSEYSRLKNDIEKIIGVDLATELKIARALVQSTDPCIIMLQLAEGAEVFVSYSHNIGDMLNIKSWQHSGSNSGMQTTDHMQASIFVSCGGNPFIAEDKKRHDGDGFNALARMIVIAGQEFGHFADLIRDKNGQKIGRFSANNNQATAKVRLARLADINNVQQTQHFLAKTNLKKITELERHVRFFKKQKQRGLLRINTQRKINNLTRGFLKQLNNSNLAALAEIKPDSNKHIATATSQMILDMLFNLSPRDDAYKRDDPIEEEAIACIEALARVPQQVNKWGHTVTQAMVPNLYSIYYSEVIPACINAYETISGQQYSMTISKKPLYQKIYERLIYKEN